VSGADAASTCPEACLREVRKVYRMGGQEVPALRGITLEFEPGSFWAIMGPSGSGKSTLLNILGCLDRPTSGRYLLQGEDVGTLDDDTLSELRLRRLGFVFQSFNLIPQLTVEENIQLPLYYLGWDPDESIERARKLAGKLDLGERLGHRPAELSGGQQQRVAIARALANDPSVILADEPTGNVDSRMGQEIMEIISGLNRSGKTIIMVTHESYIADFARQRLYMKDGAVERTEGER
jgi:putative ABC transport system ATP-binding protein